MRYRAIALVLSLVCLLLSPRAFADKKDDSDKDKKPAPAKKAAEKAPAAPQHQPTPQPQPHSSSGSTTTSGNSSGSHEHSADHHHSAQGTTGQNQPTGEPTHHTPAATHDAVSSTGHSTHQAHETSSTHGTNSSHAVHEHVVVVDRVHLHEKMQYHPNVNERQHAYERYRAERVQFHHHVAPIHFVPAHRVVLTRIRIVPTTYHYRRTVFYDEYGWQAPVYLYSMYPRYGLWDATFLMFALDHVAEEQYALMFYHHQREEDLQRWLADSDRLAADNQELRDKLDAMKVQMARLDDTGLTNDPSYVPPDAQDVALSPEVIEQLTSK